MTDKKSIAQLCQEGRDYFSDSPCYKKGIWTRRNIFKKGLVTTFGTAALPGIIQMLYAKRAYGANCDVATAAAGTVVAPFLQIELDRGWAPAAEFVFGKQNGNGAFEPLSETAYNLLGMTQDKAMTADESMGGRLAQFPVGFRSGLLSALSPEAALAVVIAGGAGKSDDDNANETQNATRLALQVSQAEAKIVQLVGVRANNATTLGRQASIGVEDASSSISTGFVNSAATAGGLVDVGAIARALSDSAATSILQAAERLSASQLASFQAKSLPEQLKSLVECGYVGSTKLATEITPESLNPFGVTPDPNLAGLPAIENNETYDDAALKTIVKMLIDGNTAAATVVKSDYDFHAVGNNAQPNKSADVGRTAGIALEAAFRANKPMFVYISTDGAATAVGGPNGDGRTFQNDENGTASGWLMLAIGPNGTRPEMNHYQVGRFTDGGAVDTGYLPAVSDQTVMQSICAVANYAAFIGQFDRFNKIVSGAGIDNVFADGNTDYLAFKNIT